MNRSALWLLPVALAALACGSLFVPIPPTQTPLAVTPKVTEAGQPAEGAPTGQGDVSGGPPLNLDDATLFGGPAGAQTFRTAMEFSFTGTAADGSAVTGRFSEQGQHQVSPPAVSYTIFSEGAALSGGPQQLTFAEIDGTQYIVSPGTGCLTSAAGQPQNPFTDFVRGSGFLTGQAQRVLPDESINGVNTAVYAIDAANLNPAAPASYNLREIRQGRVYVAEPGGYLVRLLMDGVGTSDVLSGDPNLAGDIHYQLDILDFGQPVSITAPPECAGVVAAPVNYPTLPDAYDMTSAGGLYSYKSNLTLEEAQAFYRSQMPAAGWAAGVESVTPPTALLVYNRGSQEASITLEQTATGVTVSITSNQP